MGKQYLKDIIRHLKAKHGYTNAEITRRTNGDISQDRVSKILSAHPKYGPSFETFCRVLVAFGLRARIVLEPLEPED